MKRSLLLPLAVLTLVSIACGIFTRPVAVAPVKSPTEAVVQVEPTEAPALPTATDEPPTPTPEATATEESTEAPTETPAGPVEYTEIFDEPNDYWSDTVTITTQASGRDLYSKVGIEDGKLRFRLEDYETYLYKYFLYTVDGDVSIQIDYQSLGQMSNGVAIVCKADEELTRWYEIRLSSLSDYVFYLYDQRRKTEEGKNPYVMLGKGKAAINELYPTKPNTVQLFCYDNELVIDLNMGMRQVSQPVEEKLDGNLVGIGAMSYDVLPVTIDYDTVIIREE
jgi:hypothetical protein